MRCSCSKFKLIWNEEKLNWKLQRINYGFLHFVFIHIEFLLFSRSLLCSHRCTQTNCILCNRLVFITGNFFFLIEIKWNSSRLDTEQGIIHSILLQFTVRQMIYFSMPKQIETSRRRFCCLCVQMTALIPCGVPKCVVQKLTDIMKTAMKEKKKFFFSLFSFLFSSTNKCSVWR